MRTRHIVAALGLFLAAPLSTAEATGERLWQVCGGTAFSGYSGFALCASVNVAVTTGANGEHIVTMRIYNLAGTNGSYSGTVFTSLGLENVVPSIQVIDGTLSVTGPCASNPSGCDYSQYWDVYNDKAIGGGIKVDALAGSFNSQYSIASACGVGDGTTPGHNLLFVTDCGPSGTNFVELVFQVDADFDPNDPNNPGFLFLKGQNGFNGQSTVCLAGGDKQNCEPTTVVPEPLTMTLFGSGLLALGGIRMLRRRSEEDVLDV